MRWVQLCGSLNILYYRLSLGLEWKLTFSSPVATAEFSKFAGILSAALSQHHLLGIEIAHFELIVALGEKLQLRCFCCLWMSGCCSIVCYRTISPLLSCLCTFVGHQLGILWASISLFSLTISWFVSISLWIHRVMILWLDKSWNWVYKLSSYSFLSKLLQLF